MSKEVIVVAIFGGSTSGFIISWFAVAARIVTTPTLLSLLIFRSFKQQNVQDSDYKKFKEPMRDIVQSVHNQNKNPNFIKLKPLNWDKNPSIKEGAQRLDLLLDRSF